MLVLKRGYFAAAYSHAERLVVPRPAELLKKLQHFTKEGPDRCEMITDYDYTLTQYKESGRRLLNSFEGLQYCLSDDQKRRCNELARRYYPVEADSSIPHAAKLHLMEEWYIQKNKIILETKISHKEIKKPLEDRKLLLRNGIDSLFSICKSVKLPVRVVSAGAGDVIRESFSFLPYGNEVSVLSNFIEFDAAGIGVGFMDPVVNSLTKVKLLESLPRRMNAIVLGDLPSDLLLAEDRDKDKVISVGFYNRDFQFEAYEMFDLIVMNDGNLHSVELLLAIIANASKPTYPSLEPLQEIVNRVQIG